MGKGSTRLNEIDDNQGEKKDLITHPNLQRNLPVTEDINATSRLLCLLRNWIEKENLTAHYHNLNFWLSQHSSTVGLWAEFSLIDVSSEEIGKSCFGSS